MIFLSNGNDSVFLISDQYFNDRYILINKYKNLWVKKNKIKARKTSENTEGASKSKNADSMENKILVNITLEKKKKTESSLKQ